MKKINAGILSASPGLAALSSPHSSFEKTASAVTSTASLSPKMGGLKNLQEKLLAAREKYEVKLPPADLARHEENQTRIANAVQDFKDRLEQENPDISPQAIRLSIEENIAGILQTAQFDPEPYRAKESGGVHAYGKYLMYTDENKGAPFCFQFFRFDGRQKTPIHDHPCACTSLVIFGQVRERHYEIIDGEAIKTKKEDRHPGSSRTIDLQTNNPHSIKNSGSAPAGTLHVYRIDGVERAVAVRKVFTANDGHRKALSAVFKEKTSSVS